MNRPSEDIVDMLEAESNLGLTYNTNLFIERQPDTPDNNVTVITTAGFPPAMTLGNDANLYYPSVQILIRNRSSLVGYNLAHNIMTCLHGRGPEVWNGTTYLTISCSNEPFLLAWDEKSRCCYSINFSLIRRS